MQKHLLLSLLAGVVMFVWGFISWAVLPWHMSVANKFTDEAAISIALKANAPTAGIYFLPFAEEDHGPNQVGAFASVLPHGTDMNIGKLMLTGVLIQILSAFIGIAIVNQTNKTDIVSIVSVFALIGLAVGFVSHAPYWNWFGFSTSYVLVVIADTLITWILAGLAVSKFLKTPKNLF